MSAAVTQSPKISAAQCKVKQLFLLDYFNARHFAPVLGRFLSADPGNASATLTDPQTWNGYSYVRNSPMHMIDPTGLACIYSGSGDVNNQDNFYDDDSPGPNCGLAFSTGQNNAVSATVTAPNPSDFEYFFTISTNEIPTYYENDVPLNQYATQVVTRVGQNLPTICGGGVYFYQGFKADYLGFEGGGGGITEIDSQSGASTGTFAEVSVGNGANLGAGGFAMRDSAGNMSYTGFVYGGATAHVGVGGVSVGTVGFSSGVGLYGEAHAGGMVGGFGVYANITTKAGCQTGKK